MTVVDDVVSVVIKADSKSDVTRWRGNSMSSQYLAGLYESGAVIALKLIIREPGGDEIEIVPLLNVANRNDADLLNRLTAQNVFHIHFLQGKGQYVFSRRLNQGDDQRDILNQLMVKAEQHNRTCRQLSWDDAQQQFIQALAHAEDQ
jgi:hypothetical protein